VTVMPARRERAVPRPGSDQTWVRPWLRAEGLATFAAGLAGFLSLGLPWWAFVLLLLVPDISMVGYLRGPRLGAIVYDVAHELPKAEARTGRMQDSSNDRTLCSRRAADVGLFTGRSGPWASPFRAHRR
jgi:hypothetical protein